MSERTNKDTALPEYTFNGSGGHCNVCPQVHFTSYVTARQHIDGIKHQKALRSFSGIKLGVEALDSMENVSLDSKSSPLEGDGFRGLGEAKSTNQYFTQNAVSSGAEFNGKSGYCYDCKCALTSKEQAKQHFEGQQHKRKANGMTSVASPVQSLEYMTANTTIESLKHDCTIQLDSSRKGKCSICDITLTSLKHANEHAAGEKHKKLKHAMTSAPQLSMIGHASTAGVVGQLLSEHRCFVCEVSFTSPKSREDHLNGERHMKNMNRSSISSARRGILPGEAENSPSEAFSNLALSCPNTAIDMKSDVMNGNVYYCEVCDVGMNSKEQFDAHIGGTKHKKKIKERDLSPNNKQSLRVDGESTLMGSVKGQSYLDHKGEYSQFSGISSTLSDLTGASGFPSESIPSNVSFENPTGMSWDLGLNGTDHIARFPGFASMGSVNEPLSESPPPYSSRSGSSLTIPKHVLASVKGDSTSLKSSDSGLTLPSNMSDLVK